MFNYHIDVINPISMAILTKPLALAPDTKHKPVKAYTNQGVWNYSLNWQLERSNNEERN